MEAKSLKIVGTGPYGHETKIYFDGVEVKRCKQAFVDFDAEGMTEVHLILIPETIDIETKAKVSYGKD
jgi:hypothetical protein